MNDNGERLVYSTDDGRICPKCEKAEANCICTKEAEIPETDGIIRVRRETKGRKGKVVTVARGFDKSAADLKPFAKRAKAHCGSGGTAKDGSIEIQGDHKDKLIAFLEKEGHTVKGEGG